MTWSSDCAPNAGATAMDQTPTTGIRAGPLWIHRSYRRRAARAGRCASFAEMGLMPLAEYEQGLREMYLKPDERSRDGQQDSDGP